MIKLILNANAIFAQIYISKKWGFTKWDREEYEEMRASGKLQPDGVTVQVLSNFKLDMTLIFELFSLQIKF